MTKMFQVRAWPSIGFLLIYFVVLALGGSLRGADGDTTNNVPCTFSVDPTSQSHPYTSEFFIYNVYAPNGCEWTVVNTNDWMIIKLYTNGVGTGIVRYTVFDNPTVHPRDGYLTVEGQPFYVWQAGAPCSYSILPTNRLSGTGVDNITVSVFSLADCPWEVVNTNTWITVNSPPGGVGNGSVSLTVAPTLSASERVGYVLIAGVPFKVTQLGTPCRYALASTSRSVAYQPSTNTVAVDTTSSCWWRVFTTNDWITLGSPATVTGDGTVRYYVDQNPNTYARTGILMIAEQPFRITQAAAPCTYTLNPVSASYIYNGGVGSFNLIAPQGCPWTVSNTNNWITMLSAPSGSGSNSFTFIVQTNMGATRTGTVRVNTSNFTVTQTGATAPAFTRQPANQNALAGGKVSFEVEVTGSTPLVYQWTFNGAPLEDDAFVSGSGSPLLTLEQLETSQAGNYAVTVSNIKGSTNSAAATLRINSQPVLEPIPDKSLSRGATLAMRIQATDPDLPAQRLTYSLAPGAPSGAAINPTNGTFTWSPSTSAPLGSNRITVRVVDNGTPALSNAQSFAISLVSGLATNVSLVPTNAVWKYHDRGVDLGTMWRTLEYDDGDWASGPARLGYGNGGEATVISYGPDPNNKYITAYFRRAFTVADPKVLSSLLVKLLRDDGGVVYINGVEVFRSNMPNGAPTYNTLASAKAGSADEYTYYSSIPIDPSILVPGENIVATEVHQNTVSNSDLEFNLELTASVSVVTPVLFSQPQPLALVRGGKGTLSVTAAGLQPMRFQWYSDAGLLAGATNSSLTLSNVTDSMAGYYYVVVSNSAGSVESDEAQVTVSDAPNTPPVLGTIGSRAVTEGLPLAFTATATDGDAPAQQLTFSLDPGAPAGAVIHPTSGLFTWIPTEAQGPATNLVTIRVTDNGTPPLSDLETVAITVRETNSPPMLTSLATRIVRQGGMVSVAATATDPDLPAQRLSFLLAAGSPAGASINPSNGLFTWNVPTNATVGTNFVTIRVVDNGTPALSNSTSLAILVQPGIASTTISMIPTGSVWKYLDTGVTPAANWKEISFNDTAWKSGRAVLGYGNDLPEATVVGFGPNAAQKYVTTWFRRTFTVSQPSAVTSMRVRFRRDDGGVVYLNGTEVRRDNMPTGTFTASTLATAKVGSTAEVTYYTNVFTPTSLVPGTNVIAVEIHQNTVDSPDIGFDLELVATVVEATNQAPFLNPIADRTVPQGSTLTFDVTASDLDIPAQTLIYSLEAGAPAGAAIHPQTGRFTWTPGLDVPVGTNTISVRVTDSGSPALSDVRTFNVAVTKFDGLMFLVGKTNGMQGSVVNLPIQVQGFTKINAFQFSLHWDPAVARYQGVDLPGLTGLNFGTTLSNSGTLTVSWDDPSGISQTLPDLTTLFAVRLELIGASGASSQVVIDGDPTLVEAAHENLQLAKVGLAQGSITVGSVPAPYLPANTLPVLHAFQVDNDWVTLWWEAEAGKVYRVQYTDDSASEEWVDLEYDLMATGSAATVTVPMANPVGRYYRLMVLGQ